jgi:MtN3 and saliva related transmembrane protein
VQPPIFAQPQQAVAGSGASVLQFKRRCSFVSGGFVLSSVEYLGLLAGLLSTFALVPQIIRVYRLKSAREISILFNSFLMAGVILWLVYGILKGLPSLIIWNAISIILNGWLLFAKLKYGREKPAA